MPAGHSQTLHKTSLEHHDKPPDTQTSNINTTVSLKITTLYLSIREQHQFVEHVEYLEARLVDGEDDCAVRVCQFVQVREKLHGGGGIKT